MTYQILKNYLQNSFYLLELIHKAFIKRQVIRILFSREKVVGENF